MPGVVCRGGCQETVTQVGQQVLGFGQPHQDKKDE